LDRRLSGPQNRSERGGEEKSWAQPVAHGYTTELYRLLITVKTSKYLFQQWRETQIYVKKYILVKTVPST